jgi:hypothetical protein
LLSNTVGRDQNNGLGISDATGTSGVNLLLDFFDPNLISATPSIDPLTGHSSSDVSNILKADADNTANELDLLLIDEIRNGLFGVPNAPGTDLAARDVQRARDHGIGTYNQVRVAYGLPAVTSWTQITSNGAVQQELQATYGSVDQIDPFEGMLAEDHLPGADVGPTIKAILADQFVRLRDGDRFFFLNQSFNAEEMSLLQQSNTLATVIEANTSLTNLQSNVFFFNTSISGKVFLDHGKNGPGVSGVTVQLEDANNNVLATTVTDSHGNYTFTDQTGINGTGNYNVAIVLPSGFVQITPNPSTILLSRGGLDVTDVNFGIDAAGKSGGRPVEQSGAGIGATAAAVLASGDTAAPLPVSTGPRVSSTSGSATEDPLTTTPAPTPGGVGVALVGAADQGAPAASDGDDLFGK